MNVLAEAQVVVIGGGIVGCSAAYYLAKAGRSVILLDKGLVGGEASGRNAGGVRQQGRNMAELPLSMESIRIWAGLADMLETDIEYTRKGNLIAAFTDGEMQDLESQATRERQVGLDVRILDRSDVHALVPHLSDLVIGGKYSPTDGHANCITVCTAFGRTVQRVGGKVFQHTAATGIELDDGTIRAVTTDRGTVLTQAVVNCAGPWAVQVASWVGVKLPIIPRRTQIMLTDRMPPLFEQFITGNSTYCRQAKSGQVHMGQGGGWEKLGFDQSNSEYSLRRFATRASELLPILRNARALRSFAGTLQVSADGCPIIGQVGGPTDFLVAAGFSGHGFALGPAVGKALSDLLVTGSTSMPIGGLSFGRFAPDLDFEKEYRAVQEPPISRFS